MVIAGRGHDIAAVRDDRMGQMQSVSAICLLLMPLTMQTIDFALADAQRLLTLPRGDSSASCTILRRTQSSES